MLIGNIDKRFNLNTNFTRKSIRKRIDKSSVQGDVFCLQGKNACYNKIGNIGRIRRLFMNKKLDIFSSYLKNWIRENDIERKSLESYKSCVTQAQGLEPKAYELLRDYTPTIDKTSFTLPYLENNYSNEKYVTQTLILTDPAKNICGTFDVKYNLNGDIIDTSIDLYEF